MKHALSEIIAAALAAASTTSCGTTPTQCGGCSCVDANASQTFQVTYDLSPSCFMAPSDASVDDASGDAAMDASSDGDAGPACYATCEEACAASRPGAICTGMADAGAVPGTVANCEISLGCE